MISVFCCSFFFEGVKFYHHADRFPLSNRKLWCHDGVSIYFEYQYYKMIQRSMSDSKSHSFQTSI